MEFNRDKFKALVHYICHKVDDPARLGAIKLNKILWLSDILAYMNWNKPITGESYLKRQFGPVPKHILNVLNTLESEGVVKVKEVEFHGFKKKEYIALEDADPSIFEHNELTLIDDVIDSVCDGHTAKSISELSHNDIWEMAVIGEVIPYEAIFAVVVGELNESDIEWAQSELASAA